LSGSAALHSAAASRATEARVARVSRVPAGSRRDAATTAAIDVEDEERREQQRNNDLGPADPRKPWARRHFRSSRHLPSPAFFGGDPGPWEREGEQIPNGVTVVIQKEENGSKRTPIDVF
jgi:hypothetical protein